MTCVECGRTLVDGECPRARLEARITGLVGFAILAVAVIVAVVLR